jgi:hypothetical protein
MGSPARHAPLLLHLLERRAKLAEKVLGGLSGGALRDHALQFSPLLIHALLGLADAPVGEGRVVGL